MVGAFATPPGPKCVRFIDKAVDPADGSLIPKNCGMTWSAYPVRAGQMITKESRLRKVPLADSIYSDHPNLIGFDRMRSVVERYGLQATPLGDPTRFTANFTGTFFSGINASKFNVSPYKSVANSETLSSSQAAERYNFLMFNPSLILINQEGRSAELRSGGIALVDTRKTRVSHFPQISSGSMLSIPVGLWHAVAPAPDPDSPYVLQTERVTTRLANHLAMQIVDHGTELSEDYRETIVRQLIELISLAMADGSTMLPGTINQRLRRMQIRSFINNNFHNSELGPQYISNEFSISLRSLSLLFVNEEKSISEYILHLRLARARELLNQVGQGTMSIKEVSHQVGFKYPAHFATAFRKKYGCSPSEYTRTDRHVIHSITVAVDSDE